MILQANELVFPTSVQRCSGMNTFGGVWGVDGVHKLEKWL